jgi:phospholipase/carboxylesterase
LFKTFRSGTLSLQAIPILPKNEHPQGLVVILHGWGANARDVAALAGFVHLPHYQLLFPNAPFPYPYAPEGRVWYNFPSDYSFLGKAEFRNQPELQESRKQLTDWLYSLEESTGIPLSRTILGGFSQGGAMTLDVGLHLPLAALMVLSGYLHAPIKAGESIARPPVLMVHGRQDQVVPLTAAWQARDRLLEMKVPVQYHELDMGHEIQPKVLSLMQSFIEEREIYPNPPQKPL